MSELAREFIETLPSSHRPHIDEAARIKSEFFRFAFHRYRARNGKVFTLIHSAETGAPANIEVRFAPWIQVSRTRGSNDTAYPIVAATYAPPPADKNFHLDLLELRCQASRWRHLLDSYIDDHHKEQKERIATKAMQAGIENLDKAVTEWSDLVATSLKELTTLMLFSMDREVSVDEGSGYWQGIDNASYKRMLVSRGDGFAERATADLDTTLRVEQGYIKEQHYRLPTRHLCFKLYFQPSWAVRWQDGSPSVSFESETTITSNKRLSDRDVQEVSHCMDKLVGFRPTASEAFLLNNSVAIAKDIDKLDPYPLESSLPSTEIIEAILSTKKQPIRSED